MKLRFRLGREARFDWGLHGRANAFPSRSGNDSCLHRCEVLHPIADGLATGNAPRSLSGDHSATSAKQVHGALVFILSFAGITFVAGYDFTPQTVERVLDLVRPERAVAIYGFSSMLEYVARKIVETEDSVPLGAVKTAWNGGEMLSREQSCFLFCFRSSNPELLWRT